MFSGIVSDVGTVVRTAPEGNGRRFHVRCSFPLTGNDAIGLGDSIAVSGACLTVEALATDGFEVVLGKETIDRTALGALAVGAKVNLERSLRLSDRLDGHLVSGHVDGVGIVRSAARNAESIVLWVDAPAELGRYVAEKGSIAVDGVSLTVNELDRAAFRVNVIPFTADHTTLGDLAQGARVNLEVDLVARYVGRLLGDSGGHGAG
jgi:riboflavin synthase